MEKIWFMLIGGRKEGPYLIGDLRRDRRLKPDTLVWRKGGTEWIKAKKIPELKTLFDKEGESKKTPEKAPQKEQEFEEEPKPFSFQTTLSPDGLIVVVEEGKPPFYPWIFLLLFVLTYFLIKFFYT